MSELASGAPAVSLYNLRKNKLRWGILALISAMFFITFLDKAVISATAPMISKEFGIDRAGMGMIFSSFVIATAIGQIPAGWFADRFGPRLTLTIAVAFWSLMTLLTASAVGFLTFCAVRFLTGLGENAAWPGGTRALVPWFRKSERGFVQGAPHLFARFATAIVPMITVAIATVWGWRGVYHVFGFLGLAWAAIYWRLYRDRPQDHPLISAGELAQLDADAEGETTAGAARTGTPWRAIFTSRTCWGLIVGAGAYSYCIFFYTTWLPTYLIAYRGFSLGEMGVFASLPLFAGMAGDVVGGLLSDRILSRTGRIGLARKAVVIPCFLLAAVALVPAAITTDRTLSVLLLAASLFFLEMLTGPWWAVPSDISCEHAGTIAGTMNTASNVAGTISPLAFGLLAQGDNWTAPFVISAAILVIGALGWAVLVHPEMPLASKAARR
jgi:sugar phosphate permease